MLHASCCRWSEYRASVEAHSSLYSALGGLLVFTWAASCLLTFTLLTVTSLDIRVFPGLL